MGNSQLPENLRAVETQAVNMKFDDQMTRLFERGVTRARTGTSNNPFAIFRELVRQFQRVDDDVCVPDGITHRVDHDHQHRNETDCG